MNDKWAAYRLNTAYELCPSYPQILYMPANLKVIRLTLQLFCCVDLCSHQQKETIQKCADFRSKVYTFYTLSNRLIYLNSLFSLDCLYCHGSIVLLATS